VAAKKGLVGEAKTALFASLKQPCHALRGAAARVPRSFGEGFMVASDPQWRSNSVPSAHKKRVKLNKTMRKPPPARAAQTPLKKASRQRMPEVGERISVHWPGEKRSFVGGVTEFCGRRGKYRVLYNDGDVQWENLTKTSWWTCTAPRAS